MSNKLNNFLIWSFSTNIMSQLLRTFAPKSSYGEIFIVSHLEIGHKVFTPKMKKKMGLTDFVSEKMAAEKCLNFEKSVITARCSLICSSIENHKNKLLGVKVSVHRFLGVRFLDNCMPLGMW